MGLEAVRGGRRGLERGSEGVRGGRRVGAVWVGRGAGWFRDAGDGFGSDLTPPARGRRGVRKGFGLPAYRSLWAVPEIHPEMFRFQPLSLCPFLFLAKREKYDKGSYFNHIEVTTLSG